MKEESKGLRKLNAVFANFVMLCFLLCFLLYIYIYIYMYTHTHTHTHMYEWFRLSCHDISLISLWFLALCLTLKFISPFLSYSLNYLVNASNFKCKSLVWKKLFPNLMPTGVLLSNSLRLNKVDTTLDFLFVAGSIQSPGPYWSVHGAVCEEDTYWPGRWCQWVGQPGLVPAQWLF